mmetsp:Transcript_20859/g.35582  ORF Transcript_20859/g.35582 Transcript_20859/m.35582 type:complete len:86 (+) Transcript_20859:193-450(+)
MMWQELFYEIGLIVIFWGFVPALELFSYSMLTPFLLCLVSLPASCVLRVSYGAYARELSRRSLMNGHPPPAAAVVPRRTAARMTS